MKVVRGTIIRCDPALKQYLLALKQQKPHLYEGTELELDAEHMFITMTKTDLMARLQPEIDYWIQENTFSGENIDEFDININPNAVIRLAEQSTIPR